MSMSRISLLLLAALAMPAIMLHAEAPKTESEAAPQSTAGQFLVATPDMGNSGFSHAVILMIHHDQNGAMGVVVNRPVATHPLAEIMDWIGEKHDGVTGEVRVFAGGPVEERIGFVLHSSEYQRPETVPVGPGVSLTSSAGILRDMGQGKGPNKALVAFGYAGWAPKQLEGEMGQNFWVTAPLDAKLIFDTDPDQVWDKAWARRTLNL